VAEDIKDIRRRLEQIAEDFGDDTYGWHWDETRMHLEIVDGQGKPIATLHIEQPN
jgi:hypothetical protein